MIARERGCNDIAVFCNKRDNEVCYCCYFWSNMQISVDGSEKKRYTFNHVFDQSSTQEDVYNTCVTSLVENAFEGYNATSQFSLRC